MPNLLGTNPNQTPTVGDLGSMAFQDENAVNIGGGLVQADLTGNSWNQNTDISTVQPTLKLDFDKMLALDPRITFGRSGVPGSYYDGKTFALAEQNLVPWSQQFDNAAWTKTGHSVVANATIAPDGTMTGYGYVAAAATSTDFRLSGLASSSGAGVYTASCYFKKGTAQYAYLALTDGGAADRWAAATVDMSGGTITQTVNGAGITAVSSTITSAANGWYRLTVTGTLAAASGIALRCVYSNSSTPSLGSNAAYSPAITTAGGEFFYLWGAQLEQRSAVSAYTPTTSAAITNYIPQLMTAAANQARFDHDPLTGECKGLLVEEQRANLWSYSAQLDNAFWTKGGSLVRADYAVAPDGTLSADLIAPNSGSATNYNVQALVALTVGTAYTLSAYVKYGGIRYVAATNAGSANYTAIFDVVSGTITTQGVNVTNATITPVGNGWFRITCTYTAAYTTPSFYITTAYNAVVNYVSDGSIGVFFWGMQLEAGSFATSYIPTTSGQVTRSADLAVISGTAFSQWFNKSEGTFVCEAIPVTVSSAVRSAVASVTDGTTNNIMSIGENSVGNGAGSADFYIKNNGSDQANLWTASAVSVGSIFKIAGAYKTNDIAASVNGGSVLTKSSAVIPNVTQLNIGYNGQFVLCDLWIKRLTYFPKRLTNAELVEMTQ